MKITYKPYGDLTKALFGSVSRGPVAEWFDSLQATITWDASKTHCLKDNIYTIIYRFFRMYSLNKVPEGNISPENLYRSGYRYPLPKKVSNRPDSNDVFCQSPCFPIQLWNVFSYVIPLHDQNSITYDMIVTHEM